MALTEQQKQKKQKKQKQTRKSNTSKNNTSKNLQEKVTPYLEHPIYECLIPHNLFESGIGNILISRLSPQGEVIVGSFIVDVYCLGVKKCLFKTMRLPEYEKVFKQQIIDSHGGYNFKKITLNAAKKLLKEVTEYAQKLGFKPHKDYHALKTLLGTEKIGFCWTRYHFGKDKMPCYIKGPNESPIDAKNIISTLEKNCGAGNFHFKT